jgi:hypothetical protein
MFLHLGVRLREGAYIVFRKHVRELERLIAVLLTAAFRRVMIILFSSLYSRNVLRPQFVVILL